MSLLRAKTGMVRLPNRARYAPERVSSANAGGNTLGHVVSTTPETERVAERFTHALGPLGGRL
jgi:hypothetical protein